MIWIYLLTATYFGLSIYGIYKWRRHGDEAAQ